MCVCVSLCVFVHSCMYMYTMALVNHVSMWRPEDNLVCWSLPSGSTFYLAVGTWDYRCMLPCPALFGLKGSELVSLCLWGKHFTHWAISLAPENLVGAVKTLQLQTKNSLESELALRDLKVCRAKMCILCVQNHLTSQRWALPEIGGPLGTWFWGFSSHN